MSEYTLTPAPHQRDAATTSRVAPRQTARAADDVRTTALRAMRAALHQPPSRHGAGQGLAAKATTADGPAHPSAAALASSTRVTGLNRMGRALNGSPGPSDLAGLRASLNTSAAHPLQRVHTSLAVNHSMDIHGHQLFMNSHLSQPEPQERFNDHTTTQVNLDRAYQGDVKTYRNGEQRFGFDEHPGVRALGQDFRGWVWDTHDTYTVGIWGEDARYVRA